MALTCVFARGDDITKKVSKGEHVCCGAAVSAEIPEDHKYNLADGREKEEVCGDTCECGAAKF